MTPTRSPTEPNTYVDVAYQARSSRTITTAEAMRFQPHHNSHQIGRDHLIQHLTYGVLRQKQTRRYQYLLRNRGIIPCGCTGCAIARGQCIGLAGGER